ncbi:hypothetical protein SAMN02745945_02913 [Peptoclostridium litorale DSM 5388]|uniref:Uncharacterized protein n=1 Tax=Peptoclostridium litorale DSM 5388 TaxID=1121324 RepID=A0A069RCK6_PEPLI|nr:hypothetical protein CLIT_17c00260 [Peptoclostridium litorale DSM 5388]SIO35722.1 hypothetical protein SAMN02745945_02913 [Peptoclostridium litorale DSM 5388]
MENSLNTNKSIAANEYFRFYLFNWGFYYFSAGHLKYKKINPPREFGF